MRQADNGIARMGMELERLVGSGASQEQQEMLRCVRPTVFASFATMRNRRVGMTVTNGQVPYAMV